MKHSNPFYTFIYEQKIITVQYNIILIPAMNKNFTTIITSQFFLLTWVVDDISIRIPHKCTGNKVWMKKSKKITKSITSGSQISSCKRDRHSALSPWCVDSASSIASPDTADVRHTEVLSEVAPYASLVLPHAKQPQMIHKRIISKRWSNLESHMKHLNFTKTKKYWADFKKSKISQIVKYIPNKKQFAAYL